MSTIKDHGAYIAAAPEQFHLLLAELRALVAKTIPDAEEIIAYNMPGFGFGKNIIVGYAAFTKQCGIFLTGAAIAAYEKDIMAAGLKATKTA